MRKPLSEEQKRKMAEGRKAAKHKPKPTVNLLSPIKAIREKCVEDWLLRQ